MEIFNLLSTYKKTLASIRELSDQIERKTSEIAQIEKTAAENIEALEKKELDERNSSLDKYVSDQTTELSAKLERLKEEKAAQSLKYEEDRQSLTEAAVSDDYVDDQAVIDEVQMVLNSTKDSLKCAVGEDTYNKLASSVEYSSEGMSIEDLQGMIDYFNDSESLLMLIGKIKNPFLYLISFVEKVDIEDREITFKYAVPIFVVVYAVMFVLLSKFIFSFVAIGLLITFIYSMVSTYFLHKMLVAAITIQTNLDTIIDDLHKQILDDRDDRIGQLDEEYSIQMEEFQNDINKTMQELQEAEKAASVGFSFDSSEYGTRKNAIVTERNARSDILNTEIKELKKKAATLVNERKGMEDKIKDCIDHIGDDLSAVGTDQRLDPVFLIDVNPETYVVSSFDFPMQSLYCIYDNMGSMYDLINLFCMQLRAKLNPLAFKITVCDPVGMGLNCLKFVTEREDVTEQNMFRILDSEHSIQEEFAELKGVIRKKNKVILASANDIEDYNNFMLSIDSAVEPYEFYFVVNPSQSLYQSVDFIQITQNGAKVGMYILAFTSLQRMNEDGNTSLKLVDIFSSHYRLARGNIKPLTKKAIVDNFSKK